MHVENAVIGAAHEVRVELEARPGPWHIGPHYAPIDGWMYNGDVPGPLIEARVGDTLVARLTNSLREPTSLVISGGAGVPPHKLSAQRTRLHCTAAVRGTACVVQPGGTTELRFPLVHAGTFWYHPHANPLQVERGLYGPLIVHGQNSKDVNAERVIVLDDVCVGRARRGPGDVLLLNGRVQPRLHIAAGTTERWHLINAAHDRSVCFSLSAPDGNTSACETPEAGTLLEPGQTADLIVGPFEAGVLLSVLSLPHGAGARTQGLMSVFGTVLSIP